MSRAGDIQHTITGYDCQAHIYCTAPQQSLPLFFICQGYVPELTPFSGKRSLKPQVCRVHVGPARVLHIFFFFMIEYPECMSKDCCRRSIEWNQRQQSPCESKQVMIQELVVHTVCM